MTEEPARLDALCRQIRELQERGLLSQLAVASVMHPDLYAYPPSYYQLVKTGLAHGNRHRLEAFLRRRLNLTGVHMLSTPSSENLTVAEKLSDFAVNQNADLLVVNQPGSQGWIGRLFGRVAEATAFYASLPVLVLKEERDLGRCTAQPGILVGIDPKSVPTPTELDRIGEMAKLMGAETHLLYVRPKSRVIPTALHVAMPPGIATRKLWCLEAYLRSKGVKAKWALEEEEGSVAASIERYAAANGVCLTVATAPARPLLRKLLLGSTVSQLLNVSKRPVLVMRAKEAQAQSETAALSVPKAAAR